MASSAQPSPSQPTPTRELVVELLAEQGQLSAPAVAQHLGLTVPAVRRHLDALVACGLACSGPAGGPPQRTSSSTELSRGPGRPARLYQLTDQGKVGLGTSYNRLASDALHFLSGAAGPGQVRRFAAQRANAMHRRYAAAVQTADPPQRVATLVNLLSADGYYAATEQLSESSQELCQHHCPISEVAHDFPELCEEETAMFAQLLGMPTTRTSTIAAGSPGCVTHITTNTTHCASEPDKTCTSDSTTAEERL